MLIAVLAGLSMMATDIVAVIEVQAAAAGRGWLAGWADVIAWLVSITCTSISVTVLTGHDPLLNKALVVVFVSAANLFGTEIGSIVGGKLLRFNRRHDKSAFTPEQHEELMGLIATAAQSGR